MICHATENGWEVIFQRAHALLAAKLVTYWCEEEQPLRWTETLNAIAQHDNGWQEWEGGERLVDTGRPMEFTELPLEQVVVQAERVVARAWHQSMWVGLLVSRHISHLYESRRGELPAMDDLLSRQISLREKWRQSLRVSEGQIEEAYALLLWADTFSLILCRRELPSRGQGREIAVGPSGRRYDLLRGAQGALSVRPWPYLKEHFRVAVDIHCLDQSTFAGEDELAAALRRATVERRVWELVKG